MAEKSVSGKLTSIDHAGESWPATDAMAARQDAPCAWIRKQELQAVR